MRPKAGRGRGRAGFGAPCSRFYPTISPRVLQPRPQKATKNASAGHGARAKLFSTLDCPRNRGICFRAYSSFVKDRIRVFCLKLVSEFGSCQVAQGSSALRGWDTLVVLLFCPDPFGSSVSDHAFGDLDLPVFCLLLMMQGRGFRVIHTPEVLKVLPNDLVSRSRSCFEFALNDLLQVLLSVSAHPASGTDVSGHYQTLWAVIRRGAVLRICLRWLSPVPLSGECDHWFRIL